jgi:hypothetical protein
MNDKKAEKPTDFDEDKILISIYLSPKTLEKLDDCLFYVKKRLPIEKRRKLSKSVFYEIGLRIIVEDYNAKGAESPLWKAIDDLLNE